MIVLKLRRGHRVWVTARRVNNQVYSKLQPGHITNPGTDQYLTWRFGHWHVKLPVAFSQPPRSTRQCHVHVCDQFGATDVLQQRATATGAAGRGQTTLHGESSLLHCTITAIHCYTCVSPPPSLRWCDVPPCSHGCAEQRAHTGPRQWPQALIEQADCDPAGRAATPR